MDLGGKKEQDSLFKVLFCLTRKWILMIFYEEQKHEILMTILKLLEKNFCLNSR